MSFDLRMSFIISEFNRWCTLVINKKAQKQRWLIKSILQTFREFMNVKNYQNIFYTD